jgi:hypothetical protein
MPPLFLFLVSPLTGWRETITGGKLLTLFFDLYMSLEPPLSALALKCIVQLASVHRTRFTNEQVTSLVPIARFSSPAYMESD